MTQLTDSIQLESNTRVLVTGATGFIGRNIVAALSARGCEITAIARNAAAIQPTKNLRVLQADIAVAESLAIVDDQYDVVINCAGALGTWETPRSEVYAVNAEGPVHLARRLQPKMPKRFLHVSTVGVTGPLDDIATEETMCCPIGTYQTSKLSGEERLRDYATATGLPLVIARPSFTYGPDDRHKLALFRAVKKRRFAFVGGGRSLLHPVFVQDLVQGLMLCATTGQTGETYILGGDKPASVRELINEIAAALDMRPPRLSLPVPLARVAAAFFEGAGRIINRTPPLTQSRVTLMSSNYGYSIAKARKQLGYAPQHDLRTGIRKTVASYLESGLL